MGSDILQAKEFEGKDSPEVKLKKRHSRILFLRYRTYRYPSETVIQNPKPSFWITLKLFELRHSSLPVIINRNIESTSSLLIC